MKKRDAVIVDMDGTLCDVHAIRHLIKGPGGFDAFHYESVNCPANPWVSLAVRYLHAKNVAILVVTARTEKFRKLTSWWLADHDIPSDALEMRQNGDYRKDFVVKSEILQRLRQQYNIIRAYDDNPAVVDLWVSEGIPVTVVPGWENQ
jgi:phosphoglycolate phosphatase-like HAD superfamily hydrolase